MYIKKKLKKCDLTWNNFDTKIWFRISKMYFICMHNKMSALLSIKAIYVSLKISFIEYFCFYQLKEKMFLIQCVCYILPALNQIVISNCPVKSWTDMVAWLINCFVFSHFKEENAQIRGFLNYKIVTLLYLNPYMQHW